MNEDYLIYEESFIFKPEFDGSIDDYINIISNVKKLIFTNYNDLEIFIKTNNKYDKKYHSNYKCSKFNKPLSNSLNQLTQLQQLTFDRDFNQPLYNSLNKLTELQQLTFGWNFNQSIEIPLNIKILKLNCNNIYLIENLPNSIEELYLLKDFDLELNNLPSSIKLISFDKNNNYDKDLNNLPSSLEKIILPKKYNNKIYNININCQFSYRDN